MPVLSSGLIFPAIIIIKSTIYSDHTFSNDLILVLTAEFERINNLCADFKDISIMKQLKNDRDQLNILLGELYHDYISSYFTKYQYIPSIGEKEPILFLIIQAIKSGILSIFLSSNLGCFLNDNLCCLILRITSMWMGIDYAITTFNQIISNNLLNNKIIYQEMVYISAANNNFPIMLQYSNYLKV